VLEVCLEKLPVQTARLFMMREWLELDTDEICKELAVTPANVWVILYRARMRLRECLDLNWFGSHAPR
jgi:RNA polymerase sigma-70 factor (ECF subfamily)